MLLPLLLLLLLLLIMKLFWLILEILEVLVDDVNVSDSAVVGCCQNVVESKGAVNEDGSAVLEG